MRLPTNVLCGPAEGLGRKWTGRWITAALLSGVPLAGWSTPELDADTAQVAMAALEAPAAVPLPAAAHEWLLYVALGLGVLNLLLFYLLYRSPRQAADAATGSGEAIGTSTRTDKRMDKRKREIDDLRQQVDELRDRLETEAVKRLTTTQIKELVRTLVHDELTRSALPTGGGAPARPGGLPTH